MGEIIGRDGSPAEHVHRVMRAHDDAVVAVFRGADDHLLIALGHEHGEQEGAHIAVGRVPAREGRAVDQIHDRPAIIDLVAGGNVEIVRPDDRDGPGLGLKRAGIAIEVSAGRSGRPVIGPAKRIGRAVDVLEDRHGLVGNRLFAVRRAIGEEIFAGVRIGARRRIGVGDHVGHGFRDAGEALPVEIMRARLIGRAERRAETVRQLQRDCRR